VPVSTTAGVKAVDVAWLAPGRTENIAQIVLFERAPEICVEILSSSNSSSEIDQKRTLLLRYRRQGSLDLQPRRVDLLLFSSSSPGTCSFHLPRFSHAHPVISPNTIEDEEEDDFISRSSA
jgi:hypothetical protein